jgi:hypothetical protein
MAEDKKQKSEGRDQGSEKGPGGPGRSEKGSSMVAPHPLKNKSKDPGELKPVEDLADNAGMKNWETAGLVRATGWREGKRVTQSEFDGALSAFRARPQGGGRI